MAHKFVVEAVMLGIYNQLTVPSKPVEYIIPYSTIMELYEVLQNNDPIMSDSTDDAEAKNKVRMMIEFFQNPFNKKKIERSFGSPWRKSPPLLINDRVTCTVINVWEDARFGDEFDTIETELLLASKHERIPILTDQIEFTDRVERLRIPVKIYDIEDLLYLEEDAALKEV